jgi:hypothetical protein
VGPTWSLWHENPESRFSTSNHHALLYSCSVTFPRIDRVSLHATPRAPGTELQTAAQHVVQRRLTAKFCDNSVGTDDRGNRFHLYPCKFLGFVQVCTLRDYSQGRVSISPYVLTAGQSQRTQSGYAQPSTKSLLDGKNRPSCPALVGPPVPSTNDHHPMSHRTSRPGTIPNVFDSDEFLEQNEPKELAIPPGRGRSYYNVSPSFRMFLGRKSLFFAHHCTWTEHGVDIAHSASHWGGGDVVSPGGLVSSPRPLSVATGSARSSPVEVRMSDSVTDFLKCASFPVLCIQPLCHPNPAQLPVWCICRSRPAMASHRFPSSS